jgi:hypothetical protein
MYRGVEFPRILSAKSEAVMPHWLISMNRASFSIAERMIVDYLQMRVRVSEI